MFVDEANHQMIEYGDSYSDKSESLGQFKWDEPSVNNSQPFKHKAALLERSKNATDGNSSVKDTKIVVPL